MVPTPVPITSAAAGVKVAPELIVKVPAVLTPQLPLLVTAAEAAIATLKNVKVVPLLAIEDPFLKVTVLPDGANVTPLLIVNIPAIA